MTEEEIKNKISEHKECCKKLAEEYRQRYNQDNEDKIALNMFYHSVISYNDYESVLALIENRDSMIMCFSAPPVLTEETVEINLKHIAELEEENAELKADNDARKFAMAMSEKVEKQLREENAKLKNEWQEQVQKATDEGYARTLQTIQLSKAKEIIKNLMVYVPVDLKEYEEAKQFLKDCSE